MRKLSRMWGQWLLVLTMVLNPVTNLSLQSYREEIESFASKIDEAKALKEDLVEQMRELKESDSSPEALEQFLQVGPLAPPSFLLKISISDFTCPPSARLEIQQLQLSLQWAEKELDLGSMGSHIKAFDTLMRTARITKLWVGPNELKGAINFSGFIKRYFCRTWTVSRRHYTQSWISW